MSDPISSPDPLRAVCPVCHRWRDAAGEWATGPTNSMDERWAPALCPDCYDPDTYGRLLPPRGVR